MADSEDQKTDGQTQPEVVLIAHLQAQLLSGETLTLLPIRHENDVKGDVVKLLEEWAETGFLLRGNIAYPWHQVRQVEVTQVEELAPHEVHQRLLVLEGANRAQMQQGFWKTREVKKEDDGKKDDQAKESGEEQK